MIEEWTESLEDESEYREWIALLADNAINSARGPETDTEYTDKTADTVENGIESEVELEVDHKIDALALTRTPFDVLRLSNQKLSSLTVNTLSSDKSVRENALQLARDALVQDVLEVTNERLDD